MRIICNNRFGKFITISDNMINLLPPQQKKEIEKEEKFKLVFILGLLILVFFLFVALILFSIQIYLSGRLLSQNIIFEAAQKRFEIPEIQDFQREIIALNQNIQELDSFYQNQIELTKILERISQIVPPGVYLTNFSWQKETSEIKILGFAPSREDLFKLKENLEGTDYFFSINFPPANWLKPKDIDFQVIFKTKK